MSNGESRESLDLLASAAEQSSPQSRIKRNTACVSCRDSKVKCNASTVPGQPCQRCQKLKLRCVVDKSHKRVSKRSKFDELVQEVQSIKQAVAPQSSSSTPHGQLPLPPIPAQTPHLPSPRADQARLYSSAVFSSGVSPLASIPSFSNAPPPRTFPEASSVPALTPGPLTTPSSASSRPAQPRALKSRVFSSEDIDRYFDQYFEHFHPYFPVVRIREPDAVYNAGPVLFWVIVVTACRKSTHEGGIFDFLVDAVRNEIWGSVSDPPVSLATINALLILSVWPLPTIRFMKDPSPIYVSLLMNSCYMLGIHTGRGDFPTQVYPAYRLSVSDEEAVYSWVGFNIISQRVSTYSGTPSTGQYFNSTIESILDRTSPIKIPMYFYIQLESAAFLHRVGRTVAANLEQGKGISHHVIEQLEEDFQKVQGLMSAGISEVDQFTILSTLLELQVFYFMPIPGFSQEAFKRNALRCHTTAQSVIRLALKLNNEIGFLTHSPHFVCRSLLSAACIVISALLSPSTKEVVDRQIQDSGTTPDMVVNEALAGVRLCSVQDGDLPVRAAKMMESAWSVRDILPATELSRLGQMDVSHRLGMGLPLDCIRRWKRQMEQTRPDKVTPQPGAGGNGGMAEGAGNAAVASAAEMLAGDPFSRVDWDAFMKDFDMNFDPALMDTVVA
ncbi:Transcriptional regulatory protein SEF1 [Diaporthe amygdali]|uniref:Transcriptional regulatory protein SEF1 n=1 Tax=Phomopsis amygdali TaxID=1214568 RepID=UPI0022FE1CC0|nr:Transcriptional regulatory protein SEF1 [Diaporthe amygdali]KAJ0118351.1 Transcriptional regulatory protein SEF1 [Diaporthe amygdali]